MFHSLMMASAHWSKPLAAAGTVRGDAVVRAATCACIGALAVASIRPIETITGRRDILLSESLGWRRRYVVPWRREEPTRISICTRHSRPPASVPVLEVQGGAQLIAVRPTGLQLRAVLELHRVLAMKERLQLRDPLALHERAPMDTEEAVRAKPFLDRVQRLPNQVALATGMQADVVGLGLHVVDVRDVHEQDARPETDRDAPRRREPAHVVHRAREFRCRPCPVATRLGASECRRESLRLDGLEQVIERVDLER